MTGERGLVVEKKEVQENNDIMINLDNWQFPHIRLDFEPMNTICVNIMKIAKKNQTRYHDIFFKKR